MSAHLDPPVAPPSASSAQRSAPAAFFAPGSTILWQYSYPAVPDGRIETVRPVTVVRDDAEGLVAWLAPGTPILRSVLTDGRGIREAPLEQRFRLPRKVVRDHWRGTGVLKIAPTGVPWSVWVFWAEGWRHLDWYVNLEDVHVRETDGIRTCDHVLDVVVTPERTTFRKDEDELAAAVAAGRMTAADAARYEDDAAAVEAQVARWSAPFDAGWPDWRPDPSWPVPSLP